MHDYDAWYMIHDNDAWWEVNQANISVLKFVWNLQTDPDTEFKMVHGRTLKKVYFKNGSLIEIFIFPEILMKMWNNTECVDGEETKLFNWCY